MAQERYGSPWLTVREAATYCRCCEEKVRAAVMRGEVASYMRPGSEKLFLVEKRDLDAWMRSRPAAWPLAEALRSRCC